MENAILIKYETVGIPAFGDDDETQIGYNGIETGYKILVGEEADRFDDDGAPFDDGEVYRSVKVVARGEDVHGIIDAVLPSLSMRLLRKVAATAF